MKKKFEIKVAYLVYDYYTMTAENEEEARELAKEKASTDSLNDFQLQETTTDIIKVEDCDDEEDEEEKPIFEVCFTEYSLKQETERLITV